ncbi:MAG: DNA mismatch repair protein MutS [Candidatus Eisenbacteria bacterium]|uniref:DNA mismatch repair protein MutS n=1 Tax=Eiseniibacteriota bacterium TaxID=2212470 RepID=A0A849SEF0_UNCEI|nr:DNA mismatch repair protein MutS [Candidatus Eisenbacteria bacterium]
MAQYHAAKSQHPDAFLFFRMGDFYELFFEDAVEAARLLGLTLTSRNKQDPNPIPMCGMPWHQRDGYVARLLRLDRKVAICDQLEESSPGRKLVPRGVTEVLTPGSVVGEAFLDPIANNFIAALWPGPEGIGLCLADASTSEVRLAELTWEESAGALASLRVSEWLLPDAAAVPSALAERFAASTAGLAGARSTLATGAYLDDFRALERWRDAARELLDSLSLARAAAAALLAYLDVVQGGTALVHARVESWRAARTLRFDAATARHLELFQPQPGGEISHTLWHHLNFAVTPLGARRLRGWLERPLAERAAIEARHDAIAVWISEGVTRAGFREALKGFPDLDRLASRLALARSTPRDLGALRDALARLPQLCAVLGELRAPAVAAILPALAGIPSLLDDLSRALVDDPPPLSRDGGVIREGFDAHRDQVSALARSGKHWIAELEASERARTGIATLRIGYNRVFGYYLEVTRPHLERVPADYERRQTLTTAERFVTPELKHKESEVLGAEDKLRAREHELFVALRDRAAEHVVRLQRAADALAELDALSGLAEAAARFGWTRPAIDDSDVLELIGARHPVVERLLPRGEFVPNDVRLAGGERQILLLTGPNMGGKSTYLRQTAMAVILAQAGSYVPVERARIGIVDRLFTRVGAADRLGSGHSTFMVEMQETADILRNSTPRSLVLLDEIGRGTATYDGLALAWAVTEHLHAADGPRPRTIFATHYHELTQLSDSLTRLRNVNVTVKEWGDDIVFLHRIAEGSADRSYGIHVAQLAGLPARVIARAKQVLHELESERTAEHLGGSITTGGAEGGRSVDGVVGLPARELDPRLEELDRLVPDTMTPIEALQKLIEWKRRGVPPAPR